MAQKIPEIPDISWLNLYMETETFLEKRMENDANGNPIYVGWAMPGASVSDAVWFIIKIEYDANQAVTHQWVASNAPVFGYVWNDRATYF